MSALELLQEKHDRLRAKLSQALLKKHALELRINRELERLEETGVSLEIRSGQQLAAKQVAVSCQRAELD